MEAILRLKPDVAIIDISLKDSSGIELIKDLKQTQPATAVLVLSMHEEAHYAERALRAGADGYITKPINFEEFAKAVADLGMYWLMLNKTAPDVSPSGRRS